MACVDQAPATAEYKLLQLRQCLGEEALKVVQRFGSLCISILDDKGGIGKKIWWSAMQKLKEF